MQKPAGVASLGNALIAVVNLVVVFAMLGPALAYAPRDSIGTMAVLVKTNPAPLVVLEVLKLLSAACALVILIAVRERLSARNAPNTGWAMLAGFAGSAFYSLSGLIGIFAIAQSGRAGTSDSTAARAYEEISALVTYLGLFALLGYGIWYLLTASAAIRHGGLPRQLAYWTFLLGAGDVLAFIFPPVAIIVLMIGLVWNIAYGTFVLREDTSTSRDRG